MLLDLFPRRDSMRSAILSVALVCTAVSLLFWRLDGVTSNVPHTNTNRPRVAYGNQRSGTKLNHLSGCPFERPKPLLRFGRLNRGCFQKIWCLGEGTSWRRFGVERQFGRYRKI